MRRLSEVGTVYTLVRRRPGIQQTDRMSTQSSATLNNNVQYSALWSVLIFSKFTANVCNHLPEMGDFLAHLIVSVKKS